jgi:hypothetical protein
MEQQNVFTNIHTDYLNAKYHGQNSIDIEMEDSSDYESEEVVNQVQGTQVQGTRVQGTAHQGTEQQEAYCTDSEYDSEIDGVASEESSIMDLPLQNGGIEFPKEEILAPSSREYELPSGKEEDSEASVSKEHAKQPTVTGEARENEGTIPRNEGHIAIDIPLHVTIDDQSFLVVRWDPDQYRNDLKQLNLIINHIKRSFANLGMHIDLISRDIFNTVQDIFRPQSHNRGRGRGGGGVTTYSCVQFM